MPSWYVPDLEQIRATTTCSRTRSPLAIGPRPHRLYRHPSAINLDRFALAAFLAQFEPGARCRRADEIDGPFHRRALSIAGLDQFGELFHRFHEAHRLAARPRVVARGLGLGPEVSRAQLAVLVGKRA